MSEVPAFLLNRRKPGIAKAIVESFGTAMPPHVSIKNNRFTLVDGAGNTKPIETLHLDAVVVDMNQKMTKIYYADSYDPDQRLAPNCYSDNGVGPSSRAREPQAPTCAACPKAVWGSATSKITGKGIPACANGIKLAIMVPGDASSLCYMLRVPPNSIGNVKAYGKMMLDVPDYDITDVITRITFADDIQGTLEFKPIGIIDEAIGAIQDKFWENEKMLAALVGRDDVPYTGQIAAQEAPKQLAPPAQQPGMGFAASVSPASIQELQQAAQEPTRKPGRPRKQPTEPAAPAQAAPADDGMPKIPAFLARAREQAPPAANGPTPQFGIQATAQAPNSELDDALAKAFSIGK